MGDKNFERFGLNVTYIDSINDLLKVHNISNGVYSVKNNSVAGAGLDFIFNNNNSEIKTLLVFFSGAITNRNGSQPPFFSGVGLSKNLSLPVLSISDPSLEIADDLALSWYAGNKNNTELQRNISVLISVFENFDFDRFILIGGSGGGFASLVQYMLMPKHLYVDVFVWNPQTDITEYDYRFFSNYIDVCFRAHQDYKSILTDNGIRYKVNYKDVCGIRKLGKITYLQSSTDWHYEKHLGPFLNIDNELVSMDVRVSNECGAFNFLVDDWKGHNPPSKYILEELLRILISKGEVTFDDYKFVVKEESKSLMLQRYFLNVLSSEGLSVFADTDLDSALYAFYIKNKSGVVEKIWYSENSEHFIPGKFDDDCFVTSFVKFNEEKFSFDNRVVSIYGTVIDSSVFVLTTVKIEHLFILVNSETYTELSDVSDHLMKFKISHRLGLNYDQDVCVYRADISHLIDVRSVIPAVIHENRKFHLKWYSSNFSLENLLTDSKEMFRERFTFAKGRHKDAEVIKLIARNNLESQSSSLEIRANSFVVLMYKMIETHSAIYELLESVKVGNVLADKISEMDFKPGARTDKFHLLMSINTALAHAYLHAGDIKESLSCAQRCVDIFLSVDFFPYYSINYSKMLVLSEILKNKLCDKASSLIVNDLLNSLIKDCNLWISKDKGMWTYEEVEQVIKVSEAFAEFSNLNKIKYSTFRTLVETCLRIKDSNLVGVFAGRLFSNF